MVGCQAITPAAWSLGAFSRVVGGAFHLKQITWDGSLKKDWKDCMIDVDIYFKAATSKIWVELEVPRPSFSTILLDEPPLRYQNFIWIVQLYKGEMSHQPAIPGAVELNNAMQLGPPILVLLIYLCHRNLDYRLSDAWSSKRVWEERKHLKSERKHTRDTPFDTGAKHYTKCYWVLF